jgi:pimeloyl-ACP methyl ester carboxylesterase
VPAGQSQGVRPCRERRFPVASRTLALLISALVLASGCATPIGVTRGDTQNVYRTLTRSVLSTGEPSAATEHALQRAGLVQRFEDDPAATLEEIRGTGVGLSRDRLFALAELSFLHADRTKKPEYYLAAAVYAYAFLFGNPTIVDEVLDPRERLAADLYNLGLSHGLAKPDTDEVDVTARTLALPFGHLELRGDPTEFAWGSSVMTRFISVGEYKVRGLRNRYRQSGIGAPLAAEVAPDGTGPKANAFRKYVPTRIKVAVTAFVRLDTVLEGIADGKLQGSLELYPADEATTINIGSRRVPLELEFTSTLAYGLEGAPVWDTEYGSFLRAESKSRLLALHPYRPGRIPVVFIHGTASSPARWGEMLNELYNDPPLRNRLQFLFFQYSTSNPILLSAADLRQSLQDVIKDVDPEGNDPALRRMVLIGHSQGGLLAQLMITTSGTRFWDGVTTVPFSEIKGSPETREIIQRSMFFEPLPFVTRVVFIATPHGGSFRVSTLVRNVVQRIVTLPVTVVKGMHDLAQANPDAVSLQAMGGIPTAVDNMLPGSRFIQNLAACPIAPGVSTHSIIAVLGGGPVTGKTDGVVAYESAKFDGVASEKIVRSDHSTQGHPETILEVRRILREHMAGR